MGLVLPEYMMNALLSPPMPPMPVKRLPVPKMDIELFESSMTKDFAELINKQIDDHMALLAEAAAAEATDTRPKLYPFWVRDNGSLTREIFVGAIDAAQAKSIAQSVLKVDDPYVRVRDRFENEYNTSYKHMFDRIRQEGACGFFNMAHINYRPVAFSDILAAPYVPFKPNPFDDDSI